MVATQIVAGFVIAISAAGILIKAAEGATGNITVQDDRREPDVLVRTPQKPWEALTIPMDIEVVEATNIGFTGDRRLGRVNGQWVDGVPTTFTLYRSTGSVLRTMDCPRRLWDEIENQWPIDDGRLEAPYIAFLESDFREAIPSSFNAGGGEDSHGAFQVNRHAWPQYSLATLRTYRGNVAAAVTIKKIQGWRAWLNTGRLLGLVN